MIFTHRKFIKLISLAKYTNLLYNVKPSLKSCFNKTNYIMESVFLLSVATTIFIFQNLSCSVANIGIVTASSLVDN